MQISKSHYQFIKLVSEGSDYATAYATVCNPNATKSNCKSQGSRLAKKYAIEIHQAKEKAQKVVEQANETKEAKNALKSILTQAEVDAKLCETINMELVEVQALNSQGKVFKAKISPTIAERNKAIDTYYKRFGSNAPIKTENKTELTDNSVFDHKLTYEEAYMLTYGKQPPAKKI